MKRELNETELDQVVGGTVVMSAPLGLIQFTAYGKTFTIKGDFVTMRNRLLELYDEHCDMNDRDFDKLVMKEFRANGWI